MSRPYPAIPAPLAMFDVLTGVFDPTTSTPPLTNGTGIENQRYVVSKSGPWNFVTGAPAGGALLNAGDEVIYIDGFWKVVARGATGDYLKRDGTLPMAGPLDMAAHPVLLRQGLMQGDSDAARAVVRYIQLAAGTWATRTALVQIRAKALGDPSDLDLLPGELGADITIPWPSLLVGINGAGDHSTLVGPDRQVELSGNQIVAGDKTFRNLSFGEAAAEAHLPAGRGAVGQALVQQAGGEIAWGSVELSADVQAIALTGGATVVDAFNASGPFTIGQSSLVFITWSSALYVWSGGAGVFGLGATPATTEDIVGPILSFAGVAFASLAEAQAGVVTGKAIDPAVAAAAYLVKDGADQNVISDLVFAGLGSILAAWRFLAGGALNFEAGSRLTVQDAPRAGAPGLKDAVQRETLDSRFQPSSGSLGAPVAGKAPILDSAGRLDRGVLPFATPVDYQGSWNPAAPGTRNLRNVAGGGCTPAVFPGAWLYVVADGRWNFATGLADPSGVQLLAGQTLLLDGGNIWFGITTPGGGSGGGGSTASLLRDGSLPMTGNLTFSGAGLKLGGAVPSQPITLENCILDGGVLP